jgi:hypothetical protein
MTQVLTVDGVEYIEHEPDSERELEECVQQHAFRLFEEKAIYLPIKTKLKSHSGIASIPDAFVLNLSSLKWSIVEVELSTHPLHRHIFEQLSRFTLSHNNPQSRKDLVETFYNAITDDPILETTVKLQIGSGEIHRTLTKLIDQTPSIIVIIDKKTQGLEEVCANLSLNTKVIEFKIYKRKDSGIKTAFLFNSLNNEILKPLLSIDIKPISPEGLPIFFDYKRQRYEATWIDRNKMIYKGKEYGSPSALSVEVSGTSRNGWRDWKYLDENGKINTIEELRR